MNSLRNKFKPNFVLSTISFYQVTLKSLLSEHDWGGHCSILNLPVIELMHWRLIGQFNKFQDTVCPVSSVIDQGWRQKVVRTINWQTQKIGKCVIDFFYTVQHFDAFCHQLLNRCMAKFRSYGQKKC